MKRRTHVVVRRSAAILLLLGSIMFGRGALSQTGRPESQPVVVSVRMENGTLVYRVNGKRVEDSVQNSLLKNLGRILDARGSEIPVFVIVDVRAPFSEFGKLETALDKIGLLHRRFFVTNFSDGTMNEIHWDEAAIPIPRNY